MDKNDILRSLRLPVIVAPMFLVSGPELVIASSKAGLIGSFPGPNAKTIVVFIIGQRVIWTNSMFQL